MDGSRFDRITKLLANGTSRRSLVKAGAAALLATFGPQFADRADAASRRKVSEICRKHSDCASNSCGPADFTGRRRCTCQSGTDCPPPSVCREAATCTNGSCSYAVATDGTACGAGKTCQGGRCARAYCVIDAITYTANQVYEFNSCLACLPSINANAWSSLPDSTACASGDLCKSNEICSSGVCGGGTAVICQAQDNCHLAGNCNPQTGLCTNPAKENGTSCSDQNLCTQTDTCQDGVCTGANPVECAPPDLCHAQGICNQATGLCEYAVVEGGTPCDDGNACTTSDTCTAGVCAGTPVDCDDNNVCTTDICNPSTGTCSHTPIVCPPSSNPCLVPVCDAVTGCGYSNVDDDTTCDDGEEETCQSTCQSGVCTETEIDFSSDIDNCGGCGIACSYPHATSICSNGICLIESCDQGWADCASLGEGCVDDLMSDTDHCGTCGSACSGTNMSSSTCNQGTCSGVCSPGFADCNNNIGEDGCEISTATDANNCGSCGNICSLLNATANCLNGTCTIVSCSPGFANCDGINATGCEVNTNVSLSHCGVCNHACTGGQTCVGGNCVGCFVAGTRIAMADGTSRPIEFVAVGDLVLGADGQINVVEEVLLPLLREQPLYSFNDSGYFVTSSHPFMTDHGWKAIDPSAAAIDHSGVTTGRIQVGDKLHMLAAVAVPAGNHRPQAGERTDVRIEPVGITRIQHLEADPETQLYNLKLDGNHTYFANELLVHNKP